MISGYPSVSAWKDSVLIIDKVEPVSLDGVETCMAYS